MQRLYDRAPPNIEQDKLRERLAKLCGGTAVIYAGGVTPVEQKRTIQLIEDALAAVRAAVEEGVVVGGGVALARVARALDAPIAAASGDVAAGMKLVQSVLSRPLSRIALNAGRDPNEVVRKVAELGGAQGFDAETGQYGDLLAAGVIDPLRVTSAALSERRFGRHADPDHRNADRRPHRGGGPDGRGRPRRRRGKARAQVTTPMNEHAAGSVAVEPLFRLVYRSHSLLPGDGPERQEAALADILRVSRANNDAAGVTGALMLYDDWFAQVLEGPEPVVRALFARIRGDARHDGVELDVAETATARLFGRWAMAIVAEHREPDMPLVATSGGLGQGAPWRVTPEQERVLTRLRDLTRGYGRGS